jgi:hypothetical protein
MSIFILVMASLSASTTVSHAALRLAPTAWAGPVMLSYAGRCFLEGGVYGYGVGFLIVLYLGTVLSYSFKHHRTIRESITLRFENLVLLEEVRQANENLQQDMARRIRTEKERDALIADLQRAVNEIRALQGILPVCSSCRKIRDGQGTWKTGNLCERAFGREVQPRVLPGLRKKGARRGAGQEHAALAYPIAPGDRHHDHSREDQVSAGQKGV